MTTAGMIGPYRIIGPLGRGGMGVVYRAYDVRLGREVALKMLPADVAGDATHLVRFEREARILASLTHPNVAALYGVERNASGATLVLELVEGQTLADRIATRPIPWHEALTIARQIAQALDAVHQTGIVHRDLKPANITLTRNGVVKVLDFGLAKPLTPLDADTVTQERGGALLGTIPYMSPEQARGLDVDKRCDIWAFGCILYEMLVGRSPFAAATAADTLAAILEREPDWSALPGDVNPDPRPLIRRCLEKDPQRRLRDLGDVDIAWESPAGPSAPLPRVTRRAWRAMAAGAVLTAIAAAALGARSTPAERPPSVAAPVTRFEIDSGLPDWVGIDRPVVAFSPDGSQLAYLEGRDNADRLALRSVDAFGPRIVPDSRTAELPFFSPDGGTLGFFSRGALHLFDPDRTGPRTILTLPATPRGAAWIARDEIIVGAASAGPLQRIRLRDGESPQVETIELPDSTQAATEAWPDALPDGATVLCARMGSGSTPSTIVAVSLASGKRTPIIEGTAPHYLSSGYLVFHRGHALMGVRFDATQLKALGTPVTLIDDVPLAQGGVSHASVSRSGDVAYATSVANRWSNHLVLVDRQGHTQEIQSPARGYAFPRVSPDGTLIAVMVNQEEGSDIWTYSLTRGTWNQITFNGSGGVPVWTPDGRAIAYSAAFRDTTALVYQIAAEGGTATQIGSESITPHGWTPDSRYLVGVRAGHIMTVLMATGKTTPLTDENGTHAPTLSSDGRWLAYGQDGTGDDEGHAVLYVRRFLAPSGRWRVSSGAGSQPRWSRDGHELYYVAGETMMAVRVATAGNTFIAQRPVALFEGRFEAPAARANFDVLPDGRFVMVKGESPTQMNRTLRVVRGWEPEVRRLVDGAP